MEKKYVPIAVLLIGLTLVGSVSALSMSGFFGNGPSNSADKSALQTAIQNNDYAAFTAAQTKLTQDQFNQLAQRYQLQTKIHDAVIAGDYATWKSLVSQENNPRAQQMVSKITADNFSKYTQLIQAQDTAQQLRTQLGLDSPMGHFGHGRGMMN